jgi:tetratricopeptide (TPR) repeat protein
VDPAQIVRVPLRLKLADQFSLLGDEEKAAELYRDSLKRMESSPILRDTVRAKLADTYMRMSDRKRATEQLEALVQDDPSNALAYDVLANIAFEEGRWADAVEQFIKALLLSPGSERTYYKLASAQIALDRAGDALATLDKARNKFAQSFLLEYLCGTACLRQKNYAKALNYFTAAEVVARATDPSALTDGFYSEVAGAQIESGRVGDALVTLNTARSRLPPSFLLEYICGVACGRQKNYTEAVHHFTEAERIARTTETNRLTPEFFFDLGAAFERSGDLAQAEEYFQKCLQRSPEFAEALNYLGYMWAEHGTNLDQARDLIGRALKVEPKNAAFLDSMGWVLFKQNKPREALDYLQKAVELAETPDATLLDHLGDIFAALNETGKADEAWRKSLAVEPNERVRKKLDAGKPGP